MSASLRLVPTNPPVTEGPQVGFIGTGAVFAAESLDRDRAYMVVHIGTLWWCSCPATKECRHIRRARKIEEGL